MSDGKTKIKEKTDQPWMVRPFNSISAYIQALWQVASGIVMLTIIPDFLNTSDYLPLAFMLAGLLINLFFWVVCFLYRKELLSFARIFNITNPKNKFTVEEQNLLRCRFDRLLQWYDDLPHFMINLVFYIVMAVFYGSWIGTIGGNFQFQPLPLVPTSAMIAGYVVQKFFAMMLVAMAALNIRLIFNPLKAVIREAFYFLKRLEEKTDNSILANAGYSHSNLPPPGSQTEKNHHNYKTGNEYSNTPTNNTNSMNNNNNNTQTFSNNNQQSIISSIGRKDGFEM